MMVVSSLTAGSFQKHSVSWLNMIWTNMGQLVVFSRHVHHPSKPWVVESSLGEKGLILLYLLLIFDSTRAWTQDFAFAKQALYHLSHVSALPFCLSAG
jgi:hypothetical protein